MTVEIKKISDFCENLKSAYILITLVVRRNVAIRLIVFTNDSKCVITKNCSLLFIAKRITKAGKANIHQVHQK